MKVYRHPANIFRALLVAACIILAVPVLVAADPFVVVIDPGHGGKDFGARGARTAEKDVVLAVGKLLGQKISKAFPAKDVKVVYTRDADFFVTLQGRADIANKAKGNLFISIHANSVDKKNRNRRTINGTSVYTLGVNRAAKNLAVAQRENSVMVLEKDYTTTYQGFDPSSAESYIIFELEQNKHMEQSLRFASVSQKELVSTAGRNDRKVRQAGFWVLHATSMPSVLVELDFICNPTQEKFMASRQGQEKFAKALFNAFVKYKQAYDGAGGNLSGISYNIHEDADSDDEDAFSEPEADTDEEESATAAEPQAVDDASATMYYVQFATSKKLLKEGSRELKGVAGVDYYKENGLYKYICGRTSSFSDAQATLKKVKRKFSDAFIIRMKDGKRVK